MGKKTKIGDCERKRERDGCRKFYNTNPSFSHTLTSPILLLRPYIHTLSFSEKLPLPHLPYYFPLPCPSSHFNRFHLRACEWDCGKDGGWGRKWKAWIYRRRKGEKKRRCSSRNEPTCFLCFVLTSLRRPYICTYGSAGCGPLSSDFFSSFYSPLPLLNHSPPMIKI